MQQKADSEIKYLFDVAPEPGAVQALLPGLTWVRVPLPFVLNHVNCWLLDDGDGSNGVTLIDTGADNSKTRDLWERVIAVTLADKRVSQLVCTHGHPDHVGLAGWLVDKCDVRLHMTLAEWLAPQVWRAEGQHPMSKYHKAFFRGHGLTDAALSKMDKSREVAPFRNYPLPSSFQRIRDGETITFGGRDWEVLVCGGHAEEHASFYCKSDGILIAGDQILSKISPVVGVFPSQPWSDPLADYLLSLERLRKLPADTIVLPSHGLPFRGLHARVDQLATHHARRLDALWELMDAPKNGIALAHGLFPRAMAAEGQTVMALAETLAHAHRLVATGRATRSTAADGRVTFERT